jgi:hypothetical protein
MTPTSDKDDARPCAVCGGQVDAGITDGTGSVYIHEGCFKKFLMSSAAPIRVNGHEGDDGWDGGYYDEWSKTSRRWYDTGLFYTEWEAFEGLTDGDGRGGKRMEEFTVVFEVVGAVFVKAEDIEDAYWQADQLVTGLSISDFSPNLICIWDGNGKRYSAEELMTDYGF